MKTPNAAYRQPILECLRQMGGSAKADDVLQCVERKLRAQLHPTDYELTDSGQLRWRNTAQWGALHDGHGGLAEERLAQGYLEPRTTWRKRRDRNDA